MVLEKKMSFEERVRALGHDPSRLAATGWDSLVRTAHTLEEARAIVQLGREGHEERAASLTAAGGCDDLRRIGEAFVFNGARIDAETRARLEAGFSQSFQTLSISKMVLKNGDVWDVGTGGLPVTAHIDL